MRKKLVGLALCLGMAGSLFGAAPASASTCAVWDPDVEAIVCDTVVTPAMGAVCFVINKLKLDCFA
jgi:hypothetical protein